MIHVRLSRSLNFQFGAFSVLQLLVLIHSCRGQTHVIGPTRPIVATVGKDVVLQSFLDPVMDAFGMTVEWTRPDLEPSFVYVWRDGVELESKKHPLYEGRTSVFTEELKRGNISLKLYRVRISDEGRYRCFIPALDKDHVVQLVVGAASSPDVQKTKDSSGVVLQCESTGWYPEPEVFWLDGEGNLLSAGPTETVRGPDDLYTVSSRVTVEKRHSNSFTCRVQQNRTNQIRETKIHVPEDFFAVQSSSSNTTAGLSVSLAVCILIILILVFFVWRQKKTKTKWSHRGESDEGEMNQESEVLMTEWPLVTKKRFKKEKQRLKEEKQRREEAEEEVQRKNQELQEKTDEIGNKNKTIKKETQDKEKAQSEVMTLKNHLESKNKELVKLTAEHNELTKEKKRSESTGEQLKTELQTNINQLEQKLQDEKDKVNQLKAEKKTSEEERQNLQNNKEQLEQKLQEEKKKSERDQRELNDQLNNKQAEIEQLKNGNKTMETDLQTLMEDLQSDTLEISLTSQPGRKSAGPVQSVPLLKLPEMLRQKFQEKLQKKITELEKQQADIQEMESGLQTLMKDLDSDNLKDLKKPVPSSKSTTSRLKWPEVLRQFQEKLQKKITERENKVKVEKEKREKEVKDLNIQIGSKDETIRKLQQETQDKEKAQSEVMMLNDQLESKNKELDGLKAEVNKLTEEKKRSEEERQKLREVQGES